MFFSLAMMNNHGMPLLDRNIINFLTKFSKLADQKNFFKSSEVFDAALITDHQKVIIL